jgi:tetratricopeptide (TPR) repeat protein
MAHPGDAIGSVLAGLIMGLTMVALVAAGPAAAQDSGRVPVERSTTSQKALFLDNLVTKSVAARTIETSGDSAAIAKLAQARALVAEAHADLAAGQVAAANGKLDQAVKLVNTEARRLSQGDVKHERLQEAYAKRLKTVKAFHTAFERVAQEKGGSSAATVQARTQADLIARAEALAAEGRLADAKAHLDQAYRASTASLRELRKGDTLVRSLSFETPAEEYAYEVDRNDSHLMLLTLALSQNRPSAGAVKIIESLRMKAVDQRGRGDRQAQDGDHVSAIDTLVQSTATLMKAIRMSGLYIPG